MKRTVYTDERDTRTLEMSGQQPQNQPDNTLAQLLTNLLTIQSLLARADEGAVLRLRDNQQVEVLALYPQSNRKVNECRAWILRSAESINRALLSDNVIVTPLNRTDKPQGHAASHNIFLIRLNLGNIGPAVAVFLIGIGDQ